MNVAELIEFLKSQPQDLQVIYCCCSEYAQLEGGEIYIDEACEPRPDGWVARKRPDKPTKQYLILPGN